MAAQKSAPRGEMLVRVIVGPDQHPGKAEILKDESGVPTLGACITAQMAKPAWDLTALGAAAGDQVVFPLVFKPEPLAKGQKRNLVPMAAQETQGPNRYLLDDQSLGEAPLATMQIISVKPTESLPAKPAENAAEEGVLYVLEGSFKLGADTIKPGDAIWLGAGTPRPGMLPLDKKPLRVVELRAHGEGKGRRSCTRPTPRAIRCPAAARSSCCSTARARTWRSTSSKPTPKRTFRRTSTPTTTKSSTSWAVSRR